MKLDGVWNFTFSPDNDNLPENFDSFMPVPSCWDTHENLWYKRGIGFYRRTIHIEEGFNYRLKIGGVAHNSKIWIDGKLLSEHHGAFTAIIIDLPRLGAGEHELVISADNRFDDMNRPLHLDYFDWYSYGGIIRPVELIKYKQAAIDSVLPAIINYKKGLVKLTVTHTDAKNTDQHLPVQIDVDGQNVLSTTIKANQNENIFDITVPAPKPWSPESPNLHGAIITVGDSSMEFNIGLRQIQTRGREVFLNGSPIAFKGYNRHDSHVIFGFALPEQILYNDAMQIKQSGANLVRTSHYPPDPRFIEICDKIGLMVWCEATGWQYCEEQIIDQRLISAQEKLMTEMISQYCHHPSIVCWGFFNECESTTQKVREVYERLINHMRKLDPTRAITFATMHCNYGEKPGQEYVNDVVFDLLDWVGVNTYPGWYKGDVEDAQIWLDSLVNKLKEYKVHEKPIIISEIGGGGIPGFHSQGNVKWSLENQQLLLEKLMTYIKDSPVLNGICVWQFGDIRTADARWDGRPKTYNNKGVVDEYRRPKPAYQTVSKIFHQKW